MTVKITCLGVSKEEIKRAGIPESIELFPDELDLFCESLALNSLTVLPKAVIEKAIISKNPDARDYIRSNALYELFSNVVDIETDLKTIALAYKEVLCTQNEIDLLGCLRFRCKEVISRWRNIANKEEQKFESGESLEDIIGFLKEYAENSLSDITLAVIIPSHDNYLLVDGQGKPIDLMPSDSPEFSGMAAEDILLSRLVNISPAKIDVKRVQSPLLLSLIEKIFEGRIIN